VGLDGLRRSRRARYTVVSETVAATARLGLTGAKGFVNAALRDFLRRRNVLETAAESAPVAQFNHPLWWIEKLRTAYPGAWQAILAAGNRHPPMSLRVNRRRTSADAYAAQLQQSGIPVRFLGGEALLLERPVPVERLPGFADGLASVQDFSAQQAAPLLDVRAGMRVLDACAAPGGKAAHILELTDCELVAVDRDAQRLSRVEANLARLGLSARCAAGDAGLPQDWWDGRAFDRILADVPCTASGVAGRHPDVKWLRRPEDVGAFAARQRRILDALWNMLAPGGKLLYATCSVFPEENQDPVEAFVDAHADAEPMPLSLPSACNGQILPDDTRDGFFYALLGRR
jgi:16S rRNA (cytosine967-C5)-methyltransferase